MCPARFSLINILARLRLVTVSSVPVPQLTRETLVQWVGGCSIRVTQKTCSSRCACDFCSGSGGPARESVRAAKPAHSPPLAERRAPRTPPLVQPPRSARLPRERLGGALPSAEACVPARPPLLETVETVEAPQPPGRMAARQRAKDAAFPRRSPGERASPHGKGFKPSFVLSRRFLHKVTIVGALSTTARLARARTLPSRSATLAVLLRARRRSWQA